MSVINKQMIAVACLFVVLPLTYAVYFPWIIFSETANLISLFCSKHSELIICLILKKLSFLILSFLISKTSSRDLMRYYMQI